jgi:putative acetyltransferase
VQEDTRRVDDGAQPGSTSAAELVAARRDELRLPRHLFRPPGPLPRRFDDRAHGVDNDRAGKSDPFRLELGYETIDLGEAAARITGLGHGSTVRVMEIRAERPEDIDAIREVVTAAFDSKEHGELVDVLRASENFVPELSIVAVDDGEVIGHTMLTYASLQDGRKLLLLSPMAVRPDRQRSGVGIAVVNGALEAADARGEPLVLCEGVPDYYPRFGFELARPLGFEPPHDGIPETAWMVKRLSAYDPAIRGRVVYPPAFDGF